MATVNEALVLDGPELWQKVTLTLHQKCQTYCTSIVELDKLTNSAQTLSFACNNTVTKPFSYSLEGTPCDLVSRSDNAFYLCGSDVQTRFPRDIFLQDHGLVAYLGIPLRTRSGDIIGILLSTFNRPITELDEEISHHQLFANIAVHCLRAKWLAARSETLMYQLSHEVSHDNLTGLLNRSYLSDRLDRLKNSRTEPFTLAYLDIDNFKSINDLYGNHIGDEVIKFVADSISAAVPDHQMAFRIAGDEFAFITFSSDPLIICQSIITRLNNGFKDASHNIKVSVSIGLARKTDKRLSADQLILNATLALKNCKQTSNCKVQSYDIHLSAQYYRRTMVIDALRSELDHATVSNSKIYVMVQPIVKRGEQQWNYFEILARWESNTLGTISPIEFIEAAEQSGLIIELGERIVELACAAKKELEAGLGYKVKLSLNCSAHELKDSSRYTQHLMKTIAKYGFEPREFTIELTETVLLSRTNEVRYVLDKLRNHGFTVALDDFGTGYSSLNYIHSYPIDCIKIDATFVTNMLCNETSERVVWLIIQLAKQLGVELVAEGVESQEALEKLYEMGCEQIQGYYFSKPNTPHAIISHYDNMQTVLLPQAQ
ncbi:phosphodiesterase [Vibrio sinensis]|uniref:Phosphodiesterase n=1 Tax=Vibrio sinensis TaxID=2302434 RepID=A0A3A6QNC5_9VIBR|nr:GGDEF domain-containing phosphodiesterase [Vibrio sinensis]RJX69681.1 phosphodiesterase [Vibrio sinensis]